MAYFGIYWTFPLPWKGFLHLPEDAAAAAGASRTIRYQREVIHRHARQTGQPVEAERAFLESAPDRGSSEMVAEIVAALGKRPDLTPVMVDFSHASNWRPHYQLISAMQELHADLIPAEDLLQDGFSFRPVEHFRSWSRATRDHAAAKSEHRATILAAVASGADAEALNGMGLFTHTGRCWTRDNLRKFLKAG